VARLTAAAALQECLLIASCRRCLACLSHRGKKIDLRSRAAGSTVRPKHRQTPYGAATAEKLEGISRGVDADPRGVDADPHRFPSPFLPRLALLLLPCFTHSLPCSSFLLTLNLARTSGETLLASHCALEHSNSGKKKFQFDSRYRIDFFDSIRQSDKFAACTLIFK